MAKQKILIADDEAQIREILRIYFEKEGFEVIEAEDGAAAILKVQSEKPDILLLDIMMPVLDGIEVCKQVRKMSDLPIIMVTAKDDDDDRIATVYQFLEYIHQDADVFEMQTGCRFIENIERLARITLREFGSQFYALTFTAREGSGTLS